MESKGENQNMASTDMLQSIDQSIDANDDVPSTTENKTSQIIDFVLVYDLRDEKFVDFRRAFEKAMLEEDLQLDYETFRGIVFVKITAPFHRLAKEAERVRLEMSLRGCEIINPTRTWLSWAQKLFMTDDEVDFVSAPFQSDKLHLYEGYENPDTFFRSSVRGFLVHHMLINLDISKKLPSSGGTRVRNKVEAEVEVMHVQRAKEDVVNRIGLPYLLMNSTYMDAFVIHDPSISDPYYARMKHKTLEQVQSMQTAQDTRGDLDRTWTRFFKFQPLWKIRNYFGEKIAFYFAWQGTLITLLWIPAVLGLAVFIYGVVMTVKKFKPICDSVQNMTDNSTMGESCIYPKARDITDDALDTVKRAFDNMYTPFFSLIICLWGALFLEIWKRNLATLSYQWDVDTYREIEPDRPEFVGTVKQLDPITKKFIWIYPFSQQVRKFMVSALVVITSICIVFISVTSVILFKVSMKVAFNCSTAEDGDVDIKGVAKGIPTCLLMTTVLPSIFNGVSILLFGYAYATLAERLTGWENHRTQTDYNNSLIIKLFAFQFVNTYSSLFYIAFFRPESHEMQKHGIFNMGTDYADTCKPGSCMPLLSFQILILMIFKPFPKFFLDIAVPFMRRQFYKIKSFIQGYSGSVMQAVAAAGVIMPDHYIQREYHKPLTGDFTLTEYTEKMIQFGYIMMFSASFPLAPLLALVMNLFDLRVDAKRLLWFNRRPVAFMAGDIGMWFPIMRFVTLCGVVSNAFIIAYTSSFVKDFFDKENSELRLMVVIVFEHCVLICMYVISVIIPDMPEGIKLAQRRERYEVSKLLEEAKAIHSATSSEDHEKITARKILTEIENKKDYTPGLKRKNAITAELRVETPPKTNDSNNLLDTIPIPKRRSALTMSLRDDAVNHSTVTTSELLVIPTKSGPPSEMHTNTQISTDVDDLEDLQHDVSVSVPSLPPSKPPTAKTFHEMEHDNRSMIPNSISSDNDCLSILPNSVATPPRQRRGSFQPV